MTHSICLPYSGIDRTGKVALVRRGGCGSSDKAQNVKGSVGGSAFIQVKAPSLTGRIFFPFLP